MNNKIVATAYHKKGGVLHFQVRLATAVVFGGIALAVTWVGGVWFTLFAIIIGAVVLYEWIALTHSKQAPFSCWFAWFWFALTSIFLLYAESALLVIGVLLLGATMLAIISWRSGRGWPMLGLLYAGLPVIALSLLRGDEPFGLTAIIFLFACVWTTDIVAYFSGRIIGGPKLAPHFSPNKTWAGAIGGVVAAVVVGIMVAMIVVLASTMIVMFLAFVLSVTTQCGDLAESWVKRAFGAKDSGWLLPGHGGFMDRVDGLVVAAIVMYLIGAILADPDMPSAIFLSM